MSRKRPAGDPQAAHRTNRCQHCETSWISCRALTRHRHLIRMADLVWGGDRWRAS